MKTEAEIRSYIEDLKIACECGGRMMDAAAETMLWVLGESVDAERIRETIAEGARE